MGCRQPGDLIFSAAKHNYTCVLPPACDLILDQQWTDDTQLCCLLSAHVNAAHLIGSKSECCCTENARLKSVQFNIYTSCIHKHTVWMNCNHYLPGLQLYRPGMSIVQQEGGQIEVKTPDPHTCSRLVPPEAGKVSAPEEKRSDVLLH